MTSSRTRESADPYSSVLTLNPRGTHLSDLLYPPVSERESGGEGEQGDGEKERREGMILYPTSGRERAKRL